MSDLKTVLTETLREHLLTPFGRCLCGEGQEAWEIDDEVPWAAHVADVISAELCLSQELSWRVGGVSGLVLESTDAEDSEIIARRWIGPWVRERSADV